MKLTEEDKRKILQVTSGRRCYGCNNLLNESAIVSNYLRRLSSYHADETNKEPDVVAVITCQTCDFVTMISPPSELKE